MKTHELEKELGISKHTIFYYEKEGIVTPQRDENGYRSYSQDDLQKLIMVKFLRNLNISIDDVKAILNNELDFKECLEINQIHLEKQIKSLEEVQENIEMYVRKDLPMLPALQQIQREAKNYKLGYQKTTDTVSLGRRLTKKLALRKFLYKIPAAITPSFIMWICAASFFDEYLENIRIEKSCELLRSSTDTIVDIAEKTGYNSVYSFRRAFKRLMHISPSDYRTRTTT